MLTREQIETALDAGQLEIEVRSGRFWRVRRNGKTKTWKRDADRFEIPCKTGFRECFTISRSRHIHHLRIAP